MRPRRGPAGNALLLHLALAVRHLGMLVGCFRVAVGLRRFLTTLGVLTLAMVFSSRLVALRGALVVLGCFVVGVSGHVVLL